MRTRRRGGVDGLSGKRERKSGAKKCPQKQNRFKIYRADRKSILFACSSRGEPMVDLTLAFPPLHSVFFPFSRPSSLHFCTGLYTLHSLCSRFTSKIEEQRCKTIYTATQRAPALKSIASTSGYATVTNENTRRVPPISEPSHTAWLQGHRFSFYKNQAFPCARTKNLVLPTLTTTLEAHMGEQE